jgi:DNA (cytosine-5)-methyltransferase 1
MANFTWPEPGPESALKVKDIVERNVDASHYYNGKPLYDRIKDEVTNPESVYLYRRNYIREHKSGYSPTLVASMGQGGHNIPIIKDAKGIRKLTPKECAVLQGYHDLRTPADVPAYQIYKQIGNSVCVPVIHAIAKKICDALEMPQKQEVLEQRIAAELQYVA